MTWTVTQSSYVTLGHLTLVYRLSCEAGNSAGLFYLSVMWQLMAYNRARAGLEATWTLLRLAIHSCWVHRVPHVYTISVTQHYMFTPMVRLYYTFKPMVWLRTTCLHQRCDSVLHVHTNGATSLHIYTNGVTQHHTFTPTVWLSTTRLHQQCDSAPHICTNGVTQHHTLTPMVWLSTACLYQWYINRAALLCSKFWLWSILDFRLGIINWYP